MFGIQSKKRQIAVLEEANDSLQDTLIETMIEVCSLKIEIRALRSKNKILSAELDKFSKRDRDPKTGKFTSKQQPQQ